jgi:hypothetical protein
MKSKVSFVLIFALAMLVAVAIRYSRRPAAGPEQPHTSDLQPGASASDVVFPPSVAQTVTPPQTVAPPAAEASIVSVAAEKPAATNKLERLNQIRETFRALAAGNATNALRAAKQITNEVERETALFTLAAEWTHGELRTPALRAHAIDTVGIEAGLGIEIAKQPELALLWANELTEGAGRLAMMHHIAINMVESDPAAAFALSEQLPESDRRSFSDSVFAKWAGDDTQAALNWADQLPDQSERDGAIQAIRTSAPVGIGTALKVEDGYPVITELIPGTPAQKSGQLRPGDRILALAQGDGAFINAQSVPLEQIVAMVRGAPNTMLQLQVLAPDAPPNSPPRRVTIFRDQIKFGPK